MSMRGESGRPRFRGLGDMSLGQILLEGRAFIALALIVVIFASLSENYLTLSNLIIMTKHVAINALLAIGVLMVILKGGIDLSVGSTVALSGIIAGYSLQGIVIPGTETVAYPAVWVVFILAVASGAVVGWVNGVLVTRFNVAPFIATLGMLYVARGVALLIADGKTFPRLQGNPEFGNTGFSALGQDSFLGIPPGVWFMLIVGIAASILLNRTAFGRHLYAIGGNERAAELAGVPVNKVKLRAYVISGITAAIAGVVIASELTAATPQTGETFELNAIAAVVIGGAALAGGRGHVRGTILGAFVIGFLEDGLVIMGVSEFWKLVIKGAVIIIAVAIDAAQHGTRRQGKKSPKGDKDPNQSSEPQAE